MTTPSTATPTQPGTTVLELRVRNHPGAMSHITGLFSRRAFNLEAILCVPNEDDAGATSTMLLGVADEPRLELFERQLEKLHDVLAVRRWTGVAPGFFPGLLAFTREKGEGLSGQPVEARSIA